MTLGIVVALHREGRVALRAVAAAGTGSQARVTVSGMGPRRARLAADSLLYAGATVLVSVGLAGALSPELRAGDLVLPETVASDGGEGLDVHRDRRAAVRERIGARGVLHGGLLVSVAAPVGDARARRRLARDTGALCADMESAAVAEAARAAGVPFVALRAISDPVDLPLARCVLGAVNDFGDVQPLRLARGLAQRPWEIAALLRLAVGARRAERALLHALVAALPSLCAARGGLRG